MARACEEGALLSSHADTPSQETDKGACECAYALPGACFLLYTRTHHFCKEAQRLQVLQDVAVLCCDQDHVQLLHRLVHVSHRIWKAGRVLVDGGRGDRRRQKHTSAHAPRAREETFPYEDDHINIRTHTHTPVSMNVCWSSEFMSFGKAASRPSTRDRVISINCRETTTAWYGRRKKRKGGGQGEEKKKKSLMS